MAFDQNCAKLHFMNIKFIKFIYLFIIIIKNKPFFIFLLDLNFNSIFLNADLLK
jgi:hypothetical protein